MAANSMAAKNPGAPAQTHMASAGNLQAVCHFLDKVAAEVRVMIYEHVFGTSEYARFSSTPANQPIRATNADTTEEAASTIINTSILATSKKIREEALDTFYNTKIVRLDFSQLRNLLDSRASGNSDQLDMIQNIQIIDCNHAEPGDSIRSILKEALALPCIKSLSILSDCLTGPERRHVTVRQEAKRLGLGSVICRDIGRYRIKNQPAQVQFVNSKLVKLWPSAASMPEDYEALEVAYSIHSGSGITDYSQNLVAWASHTSFRLWVGLHEVITAPRANENSPFDDDFDSPEYEEYMRKAIERSGFVRSIVSDPPTVSHFSSSPDQAVPLHKLGPQHDPARLEQATEMLSMNIGRYRWLKYTGEPWDPEKEIEPSWVELGGRNVLDIQQEKCRQLRRLWTRDNLVDWPTDRTRVCDASSIREELLDCTVFPEVFGKETIAEASKQELQQLWYLRLAVYAHFDEEGIRNQADAQVKREGLENDDATETPEEAGDDIAAMYEWSADFLRRYLSYVKGIDETHLCEASETTMRKAFVMTLNFVAMSTEPHAIGDSHPGNSNAESSNERLEDTTLQGVDESQFEDEADDEIDEDVYQPFLDSYSDVLAENFKTAVAGERG
ncbi:hypothetical protein AC578_7870 [Pseudocercospora eumusae]|uniref:Uncharacterized protein n=1 Tax=Pseudocercospora eumusae TaxID=321146 RepID=A0A139H0B6_9PEZI|nr:hypothetical protein AC578_7870 [Pseudocercospora eumusae]